MRSIAVVVVLVVACGCTKPRHAWITVGIGAGIAVVGTAAGLQMDDGKSAPGDGFEIAVLSVGVGGGLVALGLITRLVMFVRDKLPAADNTAPSGTREVGWRRAAAFGERAIEAARGGDCPLAAKLTADARDADPDYYDRVLVPDAALARCRSR